MHLPRKRILLTRAIVHVQAMSRLALPGQTCTPVSGTDAEVNLVPTPLIAGLGVYKSSNNNLRGSLQLENINNVGLSVKRFGWLAASDQPSPLVLWSTSRN